jgi:carbon-monoxide dehydrogenase small subunit
MQVKLTVNGEPRSADIEPRLLLVHYLREHLGLRAANIGCDTTSCGACTVLLDGKSVKSCTMLTVQAAGQQVTTAEGLGDPANLHPVQAAFQREHGLQCGFCTPGMVMAATGLLAENPHPTETQVREGLEGNFCRCTGYTTSFERCSRPLRRATTTTRRDSDTCAIRLHRRQLGGPRDRAAR